MSDDAVTDSPEQGWADATTGLPEVIARLKAFNWTMAALLVGSLALLI